MRLIVQRQPWYQAKTEEKRLYWLNASISLLHSIISGTLALHCVAAYLPASLYITDAELDTNGLGGITVAVTTGYFFHELIEINQHNMFFIGSDVMVYAHHYLVGTFCLYGLLGARFCVTVLVLNLLAEINNWSLHGVKVLRGMDYARDSTIVTLVDRTFFPLAILFRVVPHSWVGYRLLVDSTEDNAFFFRFAFVGQLLLMSLNVQLIIFFFQSRKRLATSVKKST